MALEIVPSRPLQMLLKMQFLFALSLLLYLPLLLGAQLVALAALLALALLGAPLLFFIVYILSFPFPNDLYSKLIVLGLKFKVSSYGSGMGCPPPVSTPLLSSLHMHLPACWSRAMD